MESTFKPFLIKGLNQMSISYSDTQLTQLCHFLVLLTEWNKAINLTAITLPHEMVSKHILDSLSLLPYIEDSPILDVGTGAGLPGIPLSIMCPDKKFVLLDKLNKRMQFLHHVIFNLNLNNVTLRCERVESLTDFEFPCIISRAFANVSKLVSVSGQCLSDQGKILAMTGLVEQEMLDNLPKDWLALKPKKLDVPGIDKPHFVVIVEKRKQ